MKLDSSFPTFLLHFGPYRGKKKKMKKKELELFFGNAFFGLGVLWGVRFVRTAGGMGRHRAGSDFHRASPR